MPRTGKRSPGKSINKRPACRENGGKNGLLEGTFTEFEIGGKYLRDWVIWKVNKEKVETVPRAQKNATEALHVPGNYKTGKVVRRVSLGQTTRRGQLLFQHRTSSKETGTSI